uniref:Protein kinase domain-containing protein n=1 Tax=Amphimedon queenslandica TaxID=400682 RepID=A0A1X7TY79_AMPQE
MSRQLAARHQLSARHSHSSAVVGNSLYIWAGKEDTSNDARSLKHFSILSGEWSTKETTGDPPLADSGYSCSVVADRIYYFGGLSTEDYSYHNSLSELDTSNLSWNSLESTNKDRAVMSRAYGGMISFENEGIHHLLMIGGRGSNPVVPVQNANYANIGRNKWRTNEHSMYNLSTRNWSIPDVIGQFMPPASFFVLKKIDNSRAVVFGGATEENDDIVCSNVLYVINTTVNAVVWQRMEKPETIDCWPDGRWGHAATIITNCDNPLLVITGGRDNKNCINDELWIFNFKHTSWKKMAVPLTVSQRWCHSLSSFTLTPGVVVLLTIGGLVNIIKELQSFPKITMSTELLVIDRQWRVGDTLDTIGMISGRYKCKYELPQLQRYIERINANMQTSIQACREQAERNITIEDELKKLQKELENVREAHVKQLEEQEEHLEKVWEEKERITEKAKNKFQEMSSVIKEKDIALKESQTENEQIVQNMQSQISHLQSSLSENKKELYDIKRELFDVKRNLSEKDMMLQQCQQDSDRSKEEKDFIQKERERNVKDAQQQLKETDALQQQLRDSQSAVVVLKKSNDEQQKALKNIERHKEQLQQLLLQSQDEKAQKSREFQLEKAALQQRLRESQEEIRRCQNECSVLCGAWQIDEKEVKLTDKELGRGAYGVVMVGVFHGLKVAVKYLHPAIASYYNQERFIREMKMASLLRHPNLVQFIGATFGDRPLILTECMTTSLYHENKKGQLARPSILSIAIQVALGLNYLHLQKPNALIHRDVSSPNILLDNMGAAKYRAKVSDYGSFARAVDSQTKQPGNTAYSAPEAFNPNEHTPAMDVYSFSVLLMEMIINKAPDMTVNERRDQASKIAGWTCFDF